MVLPSCHLSKLRLMILPLCYLVDVQFQKRALSQPCTVSLGVAEEGDTDQFHITASSMSQYPCCTGQSYPSGSNGVNFIINGKSGNDCWLSMSKKSIMQKRKANITLLLLRTRKSYHLLYLFTEWCRFLSEPSSVFIWRSRMGSGGFSKYFWDCLCDDASQWF